MQAQRHLYQYMSYSMVCGTAKGKEQTMSKYIDADLYVEMQIYDDEHEEWGKWQGTIEDLLNQWTEQGCPSTIEISEDCISREYVKGICEDMLDEEMLGHMLGHIENAPSVVVRNNRTTTEQPSMVGEWIPCTKEGLPLTELGRKERQKWYGYKCSKCNFIYKGNAITESPFCQNCGAKEKG